MTKRQIQYLVVFAVALVAGAVTLHAQLPPPPPPPPGDPPCWPPPCVPVDGGIIVALGAAAVFGGKKIYNSLKSGKGE